MTWQRGTVSSWKKKKIVDHAFKTIGWYRIVSGVPNIKSKIDNDVFFFSKCQLKKKVTEVKKFY